MSQSTTNPLLQHLVTRIQQDVQLLVELGHVDASYADSFLAQLPNEQAAPTTTYAGYGSPACINPGGAVSSAPLISARSRSAVGEARALWAYNENGKDQNDLSFAAGDVIEIVEEKNEDWWVGRVHGREGLFPSNHVEKIIASRNLPPAPSPMKKSYNPLGNVFNSSNKSAPAPPPSVSRATNSVGLQEDPRNAKRKAQKDALVNTAAHSAAAGLGAGAGAAIGGKLVRAIF